MDLFFCYITSYINLIFFFRRAVSVWFFKKYEVELSAPVKGRITNHGEPVSGLEVVRELSYGGHNKGKPIIEHALTDVNGEFSFNEKKIRSNAPGNIFGQDARLRQEIYIKKDSEVIKGEDDNYYWLWLISKNWMSVPYLNSFLLQLNADLTNKEIHYEADLSKFDLRSSQPLASICYWKDELLTSFYGEELEEVTSFDNLME
ncbi:DUF6795 domain-containing protein [Shewanella sp. ENK2]|uniref:DUF6795 domain-containing protein n=1 Tax=Shewanella sp. ENK2 TaxID=2775245 RepID=UPI0037494840